MSLDMMKTIAPTIPEPGFLNGLDNLEVLSMPMAKIQNVPDGSFCDLRNLKYIELALNGAFCHQRIQMSCKFNRGFSITKCYLSKFKQ